MPSVAQAPIRTSVPQIVALTAAVIAAYLLIMFGTSRYGLGMNTDTAAYFSAAMNLLEGRGLVKYNGEAYVYYAPLYPVLLAIPVALGAEIGDATRHLHAATFAATVLLGVLWMQGLVRSRLLLALGGLVILFALPFFQTWTVVFTEAVFIPLVIISLWALARYLAEDDRRALSIATVAAMLACLTRFAGLPLLIAGALVILAAGRLRLRTRLLHATFFAGVGAVPTGVWVLRNLLATGTTTGARFAPAESFGGILYALLEAIGSWFVLPRAPEALRAAVGLGLVGLMGWALFATMRRTLEQRRAGRPDHDFRAATLWVTSGFVSFYVLFLAWALSSSWTPSNLSRLLAPMLVPLVVGAIILADAATKRLAFAIHPATRFAPAMLIVGLLAWPVRGVIGSVSYARANGAGHYSSVAWRESQLVRHLRTHPIERPFYSNNHNGVHLLAGVDSVFPLPSFGVPGARETPREALEEFAARIPADSSALVVLFTERSLDELSYTVADLDSVFDLEELSRHPDGGVFVVRRTAPVTAHAP